MIKICHVCGQEKEHKSWKSTTCNDCLESGVKWCVGCCAPRPTKMFNRKKNILNSCCKNCQTKRSAECYTRTGYMQREDVKQRRKTAKQKYYGTEHGHNLVNTLVRNRQRERYNTDAEYRAKIIARCHDRRANTIGSLTSEQWHDACEAFDFTCAYCGNESKLTMDHVVPVSNGGSTSADNIIPACQSCNSSKNNKDIIEWYTAQPFYNKNRLDNIIKYIKGVIK